MTCNETHPIHKVQCKVETHQIIDGKVYHIGERKKEGETYHASDVWNWTTDAGDGVPSDG
jgi:hypothetical protein